MKILFITRKYPPSTGGMENAAFELYTALSQQADVTLVKWGGANKALPVIYPWLLVQALIRGVVKRPDVIYLQDGVMAPLGVVLKGFLRRPTVMTVHGLEATYPNKLYQAVVPRFMYKQTKVVTGSVAARDGIQSELPNLQIEVIQNGIRDNYYQPDAVANLECIASQTGLPVERLRANKLLFTSGRLVRRKGVLWFVANVMPELVKDTHCIYLISGTGKDSELIAEAIEQYGLAEQVYLLGRTSDELLRALYNAADIFVMPNIAVKGDMEGFGLVALEAASCGTTVVASRLEGIQDAIIDGQNGLLLTPESTKEYLQTIKRELNQPSLKPQDIRSYTLTQYSWDTMAANYISLMKSLKT